MNISVGLKNSFALSDEIGLLHQLAGDIGRVNQLVGFPKSDRRGCSWAGAERWGGLDLGWYTGLGCDVMGCRWDGTGWDGVGSVASRRFRQLGLTPDRMG